MLTLGARHNPALRQMGDETGFLCKKPVDTDDNDDYHDNVKKTQLKNRFPLHRTNIAETSSSRIGVHICLEL